MATDVNWNKTEIEDIFYNITVSILNTSPIFDVRHSWPVNGAPSFSVNNNLVFLKIFDSPSSVTQQRENIYTQEGSPESPNMETTYTRTLRVVWNFYGPDSWDNARLLRDGLFYQENHDLLAVDRIFMVPDCDPPQRVPELWEGLWYERCDLTIYFNAGVSINRMVPAIETVGIVVMDHEGIQATINIEGMTVTWQGDTVTWQGDSVIWSASVEEYF